MTDDPANHNPAQDRTRKSKPGRSVVRIAVMATLGFLVIASVYQMCYEPTSVNGDYEWTLRWPGAQPGAKFQTRPGDSTRRILDHLLVDSGADWRAPLDEAGEISVQLSRSAYPSLWTLLKWRLLGPSGPGGLSRAERVLVVVQVSELEQSPPRYEIVSLDADGREEAKGIYDTYQDAQKAVLDEIARVMDEVQT